MKQIRRIGIFTGGGDAPGLNAVVRGVVKAAIHAQGWEVFGFYDAFRGLVREATGAAEADRKFRMMVAAGMARRGWLKGIAKERKCAV